MKQMVEEGRDEKGQLDGALERHVDDFLNGGSKSFTREITDRHANIFEIGKTQSCKKSKLSG